MSDHFTETTTQGYFSRVTGAIRGVLIGGVLFLLSFALLFWNEGQTLRKANVIAEVAGVAVSVDPKINNASREGKVVHFTGDAVGERLADPLFGVSRDAIHLRRTVEMYQWNEDKKTRRRTHAVGGKETTETTYEYDTVWRDTVINSEQFHHRDEYVNPKAMRVPGEKWSAKAVTVGTYALPPSLAGRINNFAPVPADESMLANLPPDLRLDATVSDGKVYIAAPGDFAGRADFGRKADPARPRVGDVRVSFSVAAPGPVSVIAQQSGKTLVPYQAKDGSFDDLTVGAKSLDQMIATAHSVNKVTAWILRLVGFVVMWIGLAVVFHPFRVLADVVGIVGDVVGLGITVMSGLVALCLSITTIAVAWLFYRPLVGIGLLLLAGLVIFWLNRKRKARHAQRASMPPVPMQSQRFPAAPGSLPPLPPLPR